MHLRLGSRAQEESYCARVNSPLSHILLAPLMLCWACRPATVNQDDQGPDDTSDPVDTASIPDFLPEAIDTETYRQTNYEIVTFVLNPEASDPYVSLNPESGGAGEAEADHPGFTLVRPVSPNGALSTLVWFSENSTVCSSGPDEDPVWANDTFFPLALAMDRGWTLLVPRNDWCDFWTGLGPEDPIDPETRFGYYHFQRVVGFLAAGEAGYEATGPFYGWGRDSGGAAAIHVAHKSGLFDALVVDSAPSSMFLNHLSSPDSVESLLGGPPYDAEGEASAWFDEYSQVSAETLVADHGFQVPLYVAWNSQDQEVDPEHALFLLEALEESYPQEVRWGSQDFHHLAPGDTAHLQSTRAEPPWGYTGLGLVDFLEGQELVWLEAEQGCEEIPTVCTIGQVVSEESDPNGNVSDFSQGAIRQGLVSEGPGVLWSTNLENLPIDTEIRATAVVQVQGLDSLAPDALIARFGLTVDQETTEVSLRRADFAPEVGASSSQWIHQYRATSLSLTHALGDPPPTLHWTSEGLVRTNLDAVILSLP